MGTNTGHVMTLANSIIGVSVLAMPFCYKQCGIVLATLMLLISSVMTRLTCHYLIKSATLARRRTFEFLAFHTFGPTGKLTVELSIIGFMLGTCVAFFVVVGDLGPAILGPVLNIENPSSIRASVLISIALFVVLPLGLLRNVDSLAAISAATIAFYICLVLKVMGEATTHLLAWDWLDKVHLWRPAGLLQCVPIFSMALSCQTQLFEIFDSIPNASLDKMNVIVRSAVHLCTLMYMTMGFFGYVAFCTVPFSGNLMLSFSPTPTSEVIKLGFVLSVAVSFPLVIFPCRASLHSLLYRRGIPPHHELLTVSNHIPETRFKCITLAIVAVSLVTGIMIPNIELVLGLVGSTIGVLICVIIPATLFLCLTTKNNNERLLAQMLFFLGILIMVLGSYANLYATDEAISNNEAAAVKQAPVVPQEMPTFNLLPQESKAQVQIKDETLKDIKNVEQLAAALPQLIRETPAPALAVEEKADVRKEPPVPEAPVVKVVSETSVEAKEEQAKAVAVEEVKKEESRVIVEQSIQKKEDVIHGDALKKEDDEIKEVQKQEILKKEEELKEKLEENKQKQQKLIVEQKKILQDIKIEKQKLVEENEIAKELPIQKKPKVDELSAQNEVVPKEIKNIPLINDPAVNNIPVGIEPKVAKQIDELKDNIDSIPVIKDEQVKRNMANGIPLPIVIQQIAPHVEGVKSVKIVENPANPNEGNVDTKALRREILEKSDTREQREKRDLVEVLSVDFKESKDLQKENYVGENVEIENTKMLVDKKLQSQIAQNKEAVLENDPLKENTVIEQIKTAGLDVEPDLTEDKENIDGQCPDKNKIPNVKFSDELKPHQENPTENKNTAQPKTQPKSSLDANIAKETNKKEEITESIIKTPAYLSNPGLVLPGEKLPENTALRNGAKPMKRDLKSFDMTQQENRKETETQ